MMASFRMSKTGVNACYLIQSTKKHSDPRGSFQEIYRQDEFGSKGLPITWCQANLSRSWKNVVRGLHIQRNNPQGKLVQCVNGRIWDVCLDVRKDSPTFMEWTGHLLHEGMALYCPPGTAHGFLAMEEKNIVYYNCTTLYDAESDGGINPFDEELNLPWPIDGGKKAIVSDKDKNLPMMQQWLDDPRGITYGDRKSEA